MKQVTCMCGYQKSDVECHTLTLTVEEKKSYADAGKKVDDKYYVCKPCRRVMENPDLAAQYMRNSYEQQLRNLGVPQAKKLADKYHQGLIELQRKKKHGTQA